MARVMSSPPQGRMRIDSGAPCAKQISSDWRRPTSSTAKDSALLGQIHLLCRLGLDQLRPLFDRGFLAPPAVKTWPLEDSAEAYQTVLDGSAGIKQVLLPAGGDHRAGS